MEKTIKIKIGNNKQLNFMKVDDDIVCDSCTYRNVCKDYKSPTNINKSFMEFCCNLDYKVPNIIPVAGTIELNYKELIPTKIINVEKKSRSLISTESVMNQLKTWIFEAKKSGLLSFSLDAKPTMLSNIYSVSGIDYNGINVVLRVDDKILKELQKSGCICHFNNNKLQIDIIEDRKKYRVEINLLFFIFLFI